MRPAHVTRLTWVLSGTTSTKFNVESPSFTPLQPHTSNGLQSNRPNTISPRAAQAAVFTPKSNKPSTYKWPRTACQVFLLIIRMVSGPLAQHVKPKPTAPEWPPDFQEFVPQGYDNTQNVLNPDHQAAAALMSGFDPYTMHSTMQTLSNPQHPNPANPYLHDPSGGLSQAAFYQAAPYIQPVGYLTLIQRLGLTFAASIPLVCPHGSTSGQSPRISENEL